MKKSYLLLTALMVTLAGCMENLEPGDSEGLVGQPLTVKATLGDSQATKTVLQSDGVYWLDGDAINMFYGNMFSGRFETELEAPSRVAEFNGQLDVVTGVNTGSGVTTQDFWAIYPYNSSNTCEGDGVTLTIPAMQPGVAGTFAPNLNPTVATAPGLELAFYNVGSWLQFSVAQEGITSATLRGNGNEDIAGKVSVTMGSDHRPVSTVVQGEGTKSITITPEGGSFVPNQYYYIVVVPQTLSEGFTLTLKKGTLSAERVVTSEIPFNRNRPVQINNADNNLEFTESSSVPVPEMVDLGLSVKWASFNLGASSPVEYGNYYAWGETEPKSDYSWQTYLLGPDAEMTKYDGSDYWSLQPEDDAAYVALGGGFRTPTYDEWMELLNNCSWEWINDYQSSGINGCLVTASNGNSIFLPAAGVMDGYLGQGTTLECAGTTGWYWSSTLYNNNEIGDYEMVRTLEISSEYDPSTEEVHRPYGIPVRPVCGGSGPSPDDIIVFADPNVKAICVGVENWDSNHDGELSYAEAAAITSIPYSAFSNNTQITSFNEFQYFTGVTKLCYDYEYEDGMDYYGSFFDCSNLRSIILPPTLKTIDYGCFRGCTSLESITIPKSVTTIQQVAFLGCSNLDVYMESETPCTLQKDNYETYDDPYVFGFLTNGRVRAIYVPDAAVDTYKAAQYWPASLIRAASTAPEDPSGIIVFADANVKAICVENWDTNHDGELSYAEAAAVTSIPYSVFAENQTITSFDEFQYFTGITALATRAVLSDGEYDYFGQFYGCSALSSIVLPPSLQTISAGSFRACSSLSQITIPSSVTTIEAVAFLGCSNMDVYMESETPCTLLMDSYGTYDETGAFGWIYQINTQFQSVKTIYVPTQECVDTYKNAQYWSSYKWIIKWVGDAGNSQSAINGHEYVDLGLSVKWATMNVGASMPEDYGHYFAWGETEPKSSYINSTYTYHDKPTVLPSDRDAATVNWGSTWRMPTPNEFSELQSTKTNTDNYTWTWCDGISTKYNNTTVTGWMIVRNSTLATLFLPAAGGYRDGDLQNVGSWGYYWSSCINPATQSWGRIYVFNQESAYLSDTYRYNGFPVRPVSE